MKKNLEISEMEHKITKKGVPYKKFNTSEGWLACWDEKEAVKLEAFVGKKACVDIVESGDFMNIKKCYGEAEELVAEVMQGTEKERDDYVEVVKPGIPVKPGERKSVKGSAYEKDPVGLAVDVFCNIWREGFNATVTMTTAIDLVKQARKHFE